MNDEKIKCPRCGQENNPKAIECEKCGVTFSLFFSDKGKKKKASSSASQPEDAAEPAQRSQPSLSRCPKCGSDVIGNAQECMKCGIIFAKYFEFLEKQKQEELVAAAADPQDEVSAPAASEKPPGIGTPVDETPLSRPAPEKAAAGDKDAKAADERLEALEKEAAQLRAQAEALKKENEALQKAQAAMQAEEAKEKAEARQKEKETTERIQSLEARAEALRKEKQALEKAEAERRAKEEREREAAEREAQAQREKAEALRKEKMDQKKRTQTILEAIEPQPDIKGVLQKHEGRTIGLNYDDPLDIKPVRLATVNEDHFSVLEIRQEYLYTFPWRSVLSLLESMDGIHMEISGEKHTFPLVVRVYQQPTAKKKWGFI